MASAPSYRESAASSRATRRSEREREIIAATRLLFDERGLQDAPIESIARAVGINKALIYRHFSSKEELYVLTLSSYLADLAERLEDVPQSSTRWHAWRRVGCATRASASSIPPSWIAACR